MELSPAVLSQPDRYKLLIGCVVPRPIALVSTVSPAGATNVAPFSFFTAIGSDPMMLLFCPANTPEGTEKDTLRNCESLQRGGTGEFVVNIVSVEISRPMAACAEPLEYGESEFDLSGFTPAPSRLVKPPRVAEAPVSFECRTTQIIRTNPGKPSGGNIVMGEVVHVWAADGLISERFHTDPAKLDALGRMGGDMYCTTRDRLTIPRGRAAMER